MRRIVLLISACWCCNTALADIIWETNCSALAGWHESSNAPVETGSGVGGIRVVDYGSGPSFQMNSWWDGAGWTHLSTNTGHAIEANTLYRCSFSIISYAGGNAVTLQLVDVDDNGAILQTVSVNPSTSSFSDGVIEFDASIVPDSVGHEMAVGVDAGWWNNLAIDRITLETDPPPANTVRFSTADEGVTKAIPTWGADTAWPSEENMRQAIAHMGADEIDVIRLNFYTDEALVDGEIGPNSRARIDTQLSIAAMAGDKPLALTPSSGEATDPWYLNGPDQVRVDRWVQLLEATQRYIGKPIAAVEPFNEPDFWDGQGTPQNLHDIMVLLQASPYFQGTELHGASTLNSDNAQWWYDQIAGAATEGSTHQLAGSTNSYVNFIQHVIANGDHAFNPEVHSLGEVLYGAEYGLSGGIWWGNVLRARGLFVRSCQGKRLGYAENRGTYSAAAVYRAPDGELYGFASTFERQGTLTPYRFVCTDRDVYYNGVGPVREFMLPVDRDVWGSFINIDTDANIVPALDGHRWKIVNRLTGEVMEVAHGGTTNGANIQKATDIERGLHQQWEIVRDAQGYYSLFNANSGKTAEVADWSLEQGATVRQWGEGDNQLQKWYIENAGDGYYYIRNMFSNLYMDGDVNSSNIIQWGFNGGYQQQWQFMPADPTVDGALVAYYEFEGNAADSVGSNNATPFGSPGYTAGQDGQAIDLDGVDDFVDLPDGILNSDDMTIATWVYWDGGDAWQRIFDFGRDTRQYLFLTPAAADGLMRFAITSDGSTAEDVLITDPLPIGQWVHVAVTFNRNTAILYIDGAARVAGRILLDPSDIDLVNNYIGKSQWPDPLFKGRLDDFRIYNYALSASDIARLNRPPLSR